jgi:hypothetical protein
MASLETLRGDAPLRRPDVRALLALAGHADCPLAVLSFAAGVNLDRLLAGTRFAVPFGQSPFAIARGNGFESMLRAEKHAAARELFAPALGVAPAGVRVVNLRDRYPVAPESMPPRARDTSRLLADVLAGRPDAPHLIDGAVFAAAPAGIPAHFEADLLVAGPGGQLRVAEVKSFPRVDDRVDPDKLGAALDQAAAYIHSARRVVADLGGDPARISDRALIVTPNNVGMRPVLGELPVGRRIDRIAGLLETLPPAATVVAAAPAELSFGPAADSTRPEDERLAALHALADAVGTTYRPTCQGTCGNARFCRSRAAAVGSPCLAGMAAARLLPGVATLARADALSRGAAPAPAEGPAAALLEQAGRLHDEVTA